MHHQTFRCHTSSNLPLDVMLQVGDHLDGKSLARMSMTSRGTHDLMNGPHASQHRYAMELSKCAMVDGLSGAPPGELVQRLLRYNDSWMTGGSSMSHLSLAQAGHNTVYMGGHIVPSGNSFIGTSGGVLYQVTHYHGSTHLDLWELPSHRKAALSGPLPRMLKRRLITHHKIQAVAIDPAQSLLAIMDTGAPETCIWFLDLRTFKPHPEAELEDVMPFGDVRGPLVVSQLEICGNTVGVMVGPQSGHSTRFPTSTPMRFFHWRTGSLTNIVDVSIPWSFYFLNEFQVLIAEYRFGTRGEDSLPILRLCDVRHPSRHNHGQKLIFPWYGPAFRGRQPVAISFVKNTSPGFSSYPPQAPFHHDPNARLVGIKLVFGPSPEQRPFGYPQAVLCILKASAFTSGNCKDYDWFSHCLAIAPAPGTDNVFAGSRLLSSQFDQQRMTSTVVVQDLAPLATGNKPTSQLFQPNQYNNEERFRVSPVGRIIHCVEPNTKKIIPTEDHLILLPDNTNPLDINSSTLNVSIVNF